MMSCGTCTNASAHPARATSALRVCATVLLLSLFERNALGIDNGLGLHPPRGWRSWNCFHGNVNQSRIERQVDELVRPRSSTGKSLLQLGFDSVGLDDNWQHCGAGINGSFHNADGQPLVNEATFPSMKAMVDYGHSKGVRMGWYLNNCICTERGLLQPDWGPQMRGDMAALRAAGWDGVKLDSCGPSHDLAEWASLINDTGKPVMIENCHNNRSFPYRDNITGEVVCPANFFRVSHDINPSWSSITNNLQCTIKYADMLKPLAGPGCFSYPDMLEVGNGGLSYAQSRSHMGAWIISSAPLVLGMDMANATLMESLLPIIANEEALNISQSYHLHPGFLAATGPPVNMSLDPSIGESKAYLWAVPQNSSDGTQHGWLAPGMKTLRNGGDCVTRTGGTFGFSQCETSKATQQFEYSSSTGNLRPAGSTKCVAVKDWRGPSLVEAPCKSGVPGTNEEWHFDSSTTTICSGSSENHPTRCLAKRDTSARESSTALPASWQVWAKPLPDNKFAVLLFNLDNKTQTVALPGMGASFLGFGDTAVDVRNVWEQTSEPTVKADAKIRATLPPHDSRLLVISEATDTRLTNDPHPFSRIPSAARLQMEASQFSAFHASTTCSCKW